MINITVNPRFTFGTVLITAGAEAVLFADEIQNILNRHLSGDWGDLVDEDKEQNELALTDDSRIFSSYKVGEYKVWIITEADRSSTTILLPAEY